MDFGNKEDKLRDKNCCKMDNLSIPDGIKLTSNDVNHSDLQNHSLNPVLTSNQHNLDVNQKHKVTI